jgi:hypothetical protein
MKTRHSQSPARLSKRRVFFFSMPGGRLIDLSFFPHLRGNEPGKNSLVGYKLPTNGRKYTDKQ